MNERMTDEEVSTLLPRLVAQADRFHQQAEHDVALQDLLSQVDALIAGATYFAMDELHALAPAVVAGALDFEHSKSRGFVAMGRLMQLQLLVAHPDVIQTAVVRAERALAQALLGGKEQPAA